VSVPEVYLCYMSGCEKTSDDFLGTSRGDSFLGLYFLLYVYGFEETSVDCYARSEGVGIHQEVYLCCMSMVLKKKTSVNCLYSVEGVGVYRRF
jgi:hypothetical protein